MTKKEQALVEALKTELAFRQTVEVAPDVPPPLSSERGGLRWTTGWAPGNLMPWGGWWMPEPACSTRYQHGRGSTTKTTTQQPLPLYSSRLLALQRMRWEYEQEVKANLRKLDIQIELEMETPTPLPT